VVIVKKINKNKIQFMRESFRSVVSLALLQPYQGLSDKVNAAAEGQGCPKVCKNDMNP
jgi:hypothetical protein